MAPYLAVLFLLAFVLFFCHFSVQFSSGPKRLNGKRYNLTCLENF